MIAETLLAAGLAPTGVAILWTQDPAQPARSSVVSQCPVSDDPEYGYTPLKPVQVGGGAMYVAARERRYLDALRGPAGGRISYKRIGSQQQRPPNDTTILDHYHITYDGLEKPLSIYLDAYHFDDELKAPAGLSCGTEIALYDPGPDAFKAMDSRVKVAMQPGTADAPPIPLGADGDGSAGVVFDHFRLMVRAVRSATAAGSAVRATPRTGRADIADPRTVIVAQPRACDGRKVAPKAIQVEAVFQNGQRRILERVGEDVSGPAIETLVSGFQADDAALATAFRMTEPQPNHVVTITYAEPCGGSNQAVLPVRYTPARLLASPPPPLPAGSKPSSSVIRVQVTIDLEGSFRDPTYVGGAEALMEAVSQAVQTQWKAEPARVNGAPISTPVTLLVKFSPLPKLP
jgi:hypothetical protein